MFQFGTLLTTEFEMADPKINVQVTETVTTVKRVLLSEDQVADILRSHFGFGARAEVEFDCRHDYLNNVEIKETEITSNEPVAEERPTSQQA